MGETTQYVRRTSAASKRSSSVEVIERHPQAHEVQILIEAHGREEGMHVLPLVKVRRDTAGNKIDHKVQYAVGHGKFDPGKETEQGQAANTKNRRIGANMRRECPKVRAFILGHPPALAEKVGNPVDEHHIEHVLTSLILLREQILV